MKRAYFAHLDSNERAIIASRSKMRIKAWYKSVAWFYAVLMESYLDECTSKTICAPVKTDPMSAPLANQMTRIFHGSLSLCYSVHY